MANKSCKGCKEDFTPTKPGQLYCKKCRPPKASNGRKKKAVEIAKTPGRLMPVKAHFCYNCGMPQPKEVIIG